MNHFVIKDHGQETRNWGCLINLPPIKLEYARSGFYFMGAKLHNKLPLNITTAPNSEDFYKLFYIHFSQCINILQYFNCTFYFNLL